MKRVLCSDDSILDYTHKEGQEPSTSIRSTFSVEIFSEKNSFFVPVITGMKSEKAAMMELQKKLESAANDDLELDLDRCRIVRVDTSVRTSTDSYISKTFASDMVDLYLS